MVQRDDVMKLILEIQLRREDGTLLTKEMYPVYPGGRVEQSYLDPIVVTPKDGFVGYEFIPHWTKLHAQ
jgi:hypothetical protein